eukprot:TRINITY_DN17357_c0_g1_i1.p1 TRINITY_DN17357_c0_g1~~TRINITY_DN17357_c0_g1_i1.p1  ORF type:complete len:296 (-),score=45.32 TRINITY_DN17357_c0_g1_i1:397-1227(-)
MRSEASLLKAAQGHRNIVRLVQEFEMCSGPQGFVLELCREDLHSLAAMHPFQENEATQIMRGVLSALGHIHELNMVHRDVKPENIALGEDGSPRLIDFGIAALLSDEDEMSKFCGTPGYAAPEILKKKRNGFPADVFAAGATFFYILSGEMAFATETMTKKSIIVKSKKCVVSFGCSFDNIGDDTKEMIRWLMQKDASWRPKARVALGFSPFITASDNVRHTDEQMLTFYGQSNVTTFTADVRPPVQARGGRARPAPKARPRQGQGTSNGDANASA